MKKKIETQLIKELLELNDILQNAIQLKHPPHIISSYQNLISIRHSKLRVLEFIADSYGSNN